MNEVRCFGASGQLGYGIPREAYMTGLEKNPAFIGCDMGSTDPGPYYLGSGRAATGRHGRESDLELVLTTAREHDLPLIIGSAGTAGGAPHVQDTVEIVESLARKHDLRFKLAVIHSEVSPETVLKRFECNQIQPCGPVPALNREGIEQSTRIVGQMGVEPVIEALDAGADVIVTGRACDTSVFSAVAIRMGYDPGPAMHQAKIIECASQCADPGGRDAIIAYLRDDHFLVESQHPKRRCTPISVAAHSLYEQPNPYYVYEPGGMLDLSECRFEAEDDRVTRISGSRWVPSPEYWVKLEGVARAGHRAFSLGATCDPTFIREIRPSVEAVRGIVEGLFPDHVSGIDYHLQFRVYGENGVMPAYNADSAATPPENFVIIDVVAESPDLAHSICGIAKQYFLHYFYDGIKATGGNIAIPFGPDVQSGGEVYQFNIYHLMQVDDPCELFPMEIREL